MKRKADLVGAGVAVGPRGVAVAVLVGVGVDVAVGVREGKVGTMVGVLVARRVLVGSNSSVGLAPRGVHVGSKGLGVSVGVIEGRTAMATAVGGTAVGESACRSTEANGVLSRSSGIKKTAAKPATTNRDKSKNRRAMIFLNAVPIRLRFFLVTLFSHLSGINELDDVGVLPQFCQPGFKRLL